jgi:hypothetical protein
MIFRSTVAKSGRYPRRRPLHSQCRGENDFMTHQGCVGKFSADDVTRPRITDPCPFACMQGVFQHSRLSLERCS